MRQRLLDWEAAARSRLEPAAADFFAAGSGSERSLAAAVAAWDDWCFAPRVLTDVSVVDTTLELFGLRLPSPVAVAPVAFHALAHAEGELASASGAERAGALYVMATRATRRIEEVAARLSRWWFQVYVLNDRGLTGSLVDRAVSAGARALVLTGDTPIVGRKPRPAGPIPLSNEDYLVNLGLELAESATPGARDLTAEDPGITEEVIGWLAERSGLPVLVKGVLRADDAERCLSAGAAGVIVSNHGGRQLDGALAPAHAIEEVAAAVDGRGPVLLDGGVRDGRSVLKALCLGADAVMVGRPAIWALAAGGEEGVFELLEGLRLELAEAMALAGARRLSDCDRSLVRFDPAKGGRP